MRVTVIFVISLVLPTIILGADSWTLFPFKLGEDTFDDTMTVCCAKGIKGTEYADACDFYKTYARR